MKSKENFLKRLEQLENLLEVNEYLVHFSSEKTAVGPEDRVIRLKWIDLGDE